jgi:predicted metalloendopeptidase
VQATDSAVGELLAQAYVKQRFLPESKEAVKAMVTGIRNELERRLPELAWMDPATREQALKKLAKIEYLIGYPDKWREYPFAIDRASYLSNTLRANAFELERRLSKVGKPVDRGEWEMTPPTVNAYYHPNKNHMVFPAGILQPPFFDPKASLPVNMGSIGMVVGHELSHGFDDQGSQYDGDGNLKSWWQPDVRKKFDELASCISDQYGGYEVLPGVKQNGKLTLGEDIADNAGVMLAYKAVRSMRKDANPVLTADGFDEDQQFFLSVGQVWCFKATDEITKLRATVDPHSHPRWRVNGSLRTQPAGIRRGIQVPA